MGRPPRGCGEHEGREALPHALTILIGDPPFFAKATKDMDIAAPCQNRSQKRNPKFETLGTLEILIL